MLLVLQRCCRKVKIYTNDCQTFLETVVDYWLTDVKQEACSEAVVFVKRKE